MASRIAQRAFSTTRRRFAAQAGASEGAALKEEGKRNPEIYVRDGHSTIEA